MNHRVYAGTLKQLLLDIKRLLLCSNFLHFERLQMISETEQCLASRFVLFLESSDECALSVCVTQTLKNKNNSWNSQRG